MLSKIKRLLKKTVPKTKLDYAEWLCMIFAMIASYMVAAAAGQEGIGYVFYGISTCFMIYIAVLLKRPTLVYLQLYFMGINILGTWNYLIVPMMN